MSYAGFCETCGVLFYESDKLLHKHEPISGGASTGEQPPRQYTNRHGERCSEACGQGRHAECTETFTTCNCTYRGLHKTLHRYATINPAARLSGPSAPKVESIPIGPWIQCDVHGVVPVTHKCTEQPTQATETDSAPQVDLLREYLDGISNPEEVAEHHGQELSEFVDWLNDYFVITEKPAIPSVAGTRKEGMKE